MNRVLILLLVALITFGLVLAYRKPEIVQEFWLWVVGLAGVLIKALRIMRDYIAEKFNDASHYAAEKKKEIFRNDPS